MKYKKCVFALLPLIGLSWAINASAQHIQTDDAASVTTAAPAEVRIKKIEPIPFAPRLTLASANTHSGLKLPRWVSLKYGHINGRKGPGKTYPHLWTFQRKGMPVIVINEMDHWRQIRDMEGGESWVRSVALSGQSTALVTQETPLLKSAKASARVLAKLDPNLLLKVSECGDEYCRVEIDTETETGKQKGPRGYVLRRHLWGVEKF